jgi:hypothetical protein
MAGPQPIVPPLLPPKMEVGFNYPWPFNRYGTLIGPRDLQNDPPTGANDAMPVWRDPSHPPPAGSLAKNLKTLRDELKITKVRMFLLCNAYNYGKRPITGALPGGMSVFTAPPTAHHLFFDHFRQMLEVFSQANMQILPSLIDFGAFYPLLPRTAGGGRTSILTSQRMTFLGTVLDQFLKTSRSFANTIFAWEVVNEPIWNTIAAPIVGRPHTSSSGPDIDVAIMASFISDCLKLIHAAGFKSTVGHRFLNDLHGQMPTGQVPQFHYYGGTGLARRLAGVADPNPIPAAASLTADTFVGELGTAPGGDKNQFGDVEPGEPWPECNGADKTRRKAAFERLKLLARKGYKIAFVWPDRSDKEPPVANDDALKLSNDATNSIKDFTTGKFPNGVP